MRARPHYLRVLSQNEGAPPLLWVLSTTNKHLSTSPNPPPPTCLQHQLIPPPYLGQGGTTYPSTPFDMKSSIAASWPRDSLLTTSQAVTMNPRSQWSLFEFGNRLNCEEICIQKFSCCSGERGHSVLACLMGRL